jgi:putative oxidoreductase
MALVSKLHALLAKVGGFLKCPLLLVIRLYWGWQFFVDGKGKLTHLDRVTAYFASLNIPAPRLNCILASTTECVCGMLLLLGLLSRFASLALIGVMSVAYLTAEREALNSFFSDPDKFTGATPFLFLFASLIIFTFGPGKIALDTLVFKDGKD